MLEEIDGESDQATTPFLVAEREHNEHNHSSDSLRHVASSAAPWLPLTALVLLSAPQIISAAFVLTLHWDDHQSVCDQAHRARWRGWLLVAALRLFLHVITVFFFVFASRRWGEDARIVKTLLRLRNLLDSVGLFWFFVGNMWILASDDCVDRSHSPVYQLCLMMILITYAQFCLPCVIALLIVPVYLHEPDLNDTRKEFVLIGGF